MKPGTKTQARVTTHGRPEERGEARPAKQGHWIFRWFGPLILSERCLGLTLTESTPRQSWPCKALLARSTSSWMVAVAASKCAVRCRADSARASCRRLVRPVSL